MKIYDRVTPVSLARRAIHELFDGSSHEKLGFVHLQTKQLSFKPVKTN
jgi:hypothetical protein